MSAFVDSHSFGARLLSLLSVEFKATSGKRERNNSDLSYPTATRAIAKDYAMTASVLVLSIPIKGRQGTIISFFRTGIQMSKRLVLTRFARRGPAMPGTV